MPDTKKNTEKKEFKIMLVGSFNDIFLEALKELKIKFILNKSSKPELDTTEVEAIVFATDRTEQVLDYVRKYKAVPILSNKIEGFFDFNPLKENGNAFLFTENTPWHMLEAVIRAKETFKFPYDWKTLREEVQDTAKYAKKNPAYSI
jgi:hypothetical protein